MSGKRYETSDIPAWVGAAALAGVLATLVVGALGVGIMLYLLQRSAPPQRATAIQAAAPPQAGPGIQASPEGDRTEVEAPARRRLATYGWTDRSAGLARIPIDRAMAMLTAKGWPAEPKAVAGADTKPEATP